MPTYEYECLKCGLIFEEFQRISEPPLTKCKNANCNGKVRRLFSPGAGFLFKGSGFYITDYRSDSYKKKQKTETTTSSSDSSKSSKTDIKTSSKTTESK